MSFREFPFLYEERTVPCESIGVVHNSYGEGDIANINKGDARGVSGDQGFTPDSLTLSASSLTCYVSFDVG